MLHTGLNFFCRRRSRTTFSCSRRKRHSSMQNWLLGPPGRILCKQPLWCQRQLWACSWLWSSHASRFSVSVSLDFPCTAHAFFPEHLSNHCQGLSRTFSEICTKCNAVPLSDPSRHRIRTDTRLQTEGRKHQHVHPAAWSFVYWFPRYANTIIYRCIALLKLLYRWQHQSRIPPCRSNMRKRSNMASSHGLGRRQTKSIWRWNYYPRVRLMRLLKTNRHFVLSNL
jgi:hypothetical protein